jgi:hypothetical protein
MKKITILYLCFILFNFVFSEESSSTVTDFSLEKVPNYSSLNKNQLEDKLREKVVSIIKKKQLNFFDVAECERILSYLSYSYHFQLLPVKDRLEHIKRILKESNYRNIQDLCLDILSDKESKYTIDSQEYAIKMLSRILFDYKNFDKIERFLMNGENARLQTAAVAAVGFLSVERLQRVLYAFTLSNFELELINGGLYKTMNLKEFMSSDYFIAYQASQSELLRAMFYASKSELKKYLVEKIVNAMDNPYALSEVFKNYKDKEYLLELSYQILSDEKWDNNKVFSNYLLRNCCDFLIRESAQISLDRRNDFIKLLKNKIKDSPQKKNLQIERTIAIFMKK